MALMRQIFTRIFQVIEQTSLIHLAVLLVIAKHDKTKKRHKRTLCGKSGWEKTCDDCSFLILVDYFYVLDLDKVDSVKH